MRVVITLEYLNSNEFVNVDMDGVTDTHRELFEKNKVFCFFFVFFIYLSTYLFNQLQSNGIASVIPSKLFSGNVMQENHNYFHWHVFKKYWNKKLQHYIYIYIYTNIQMLHMTVKYRL